MSIRALIVEDEAVAARRLSKMLVEEGLIVTNCIGSNEELSRRIDQGQLPDLLFLDIHLSDGIVFECLQSRAVNTPIIFTTAYDEFAIRAFKQRSVDYLLKPVAQNDLRQALDKYRHLYQRSTAPVDWQALSALVQTSRAEYRKRISVRAGRTLRSIHMADVRLFYSEHKATFVQTTEGRSYPVESTIEELIEELDPAQFHRVNRGQIAHIDHIERVHAHSNSRLAVELRGPSHAPIIVARDRVKAFKAWLG